MQGRAALIKACARHGRAAPRGGRAAWGRGGRWQERKSRKSVLTVHALPVTHSLQKEFACAVDVPVRSLKRANVCLSISETHAIQLL